MLVAGVSHETNTFAPTPTTRADFRERRELLGETAVRDELAGTNTVVGGALATADAAGVETVCPVAAAATPGGRVAADAFDAYVDLVTDAAAAADADGVLLALHGAMVPEGRDDGEGPLTAAVREVVGPEAPIVVTHDLHGNVSDELVSVADGLVAYRTYPHVDMGETGERGTELLLEAVRGETEPVVRIERPPVLPITPRQNTRDGPMVAVMERARELERRDGVRAVSALPGFHRADTRWTTFSIPVVGDGDPAAASAAAADLARFVWERREAFVADYPDPAAAVETARERVAAGETADGPVVLADAGDNPGGGGAGDGTAILRELLDRGVTNAGLAIMRDPESVADCVAAGVGERVTLDLGGKTDDLHGEPIRGVEGRVRAITDGEFVNTGPMGTGDVTRLGRTVRLDCGTDDGVAVVLTTNRVQPYDAETWRHVGVAPERRDVLVVKSSNHYRAAHEPLASSLVPVDSPGLAAIDARGFEFERLRRPQYPIDEGFAYEPGG